MEYALAVFLCLFVVQVCILGLIRNNYDYKKVQKYKPCLTNNPALKNNVPDDIHWEIFLNKKKETDISAVFDLQSGSKILSNIFEKVNYNDSDNNDNAKLSASYILKSLKLLMPYGIPFQNLRKYMLELLQLQYYSGKSPEYISGGYYISGSGVSGIMVPFAVALYCNYTGDAGILQENICYNAISDKPLCKACGTEFCDNVYQHCFNALNSFELNEFGLINAKYKGSLSELLNIDKEYFDIASSLLYCTAAELFLPYITDSKVRFSLINDTVKIKNNISLKLLLQLNINEPAGNFNNVINSLFYLMSQEKKHRDIIFNSIKEAIEGGNMPEEFYGRRGILPQVLFAGIFLKNNSIKTADILLENLLKFDNFNPLEAVLIKNLVINCYLGINFKCGHIKIKPYADNFKFEFFHNDKKISINYNYYNFNGLTIDGLRFNNLDYICLKGYNKDINITLGAL